MSRSLYLSVICLTLIFPIALTQVEEFVFNEVLNPKDFVDESVKTSQEIFDESPGLKPALDEDSGYWVDSLRASSFESHLRALWTSLCRFGFRGFWSIIKTFLM